MGEEQLKPKIRDLRNGDWLWINKLILDHPYLTSSAKIVYSALAYFADNDTQKSYPSFEKLAELTNLKKRTVISSIQKLEEYYFIKVIREKGKINKYILLKLTDSKVVKKLHHSNEKRLFIPGMGVVQKKHWGGAK